MDRAATICLALVATVVLALVATAVQAEWTVLETGPSAKAYVNLATIKRDSTGASGNDYRIAWVLIDYKTPKHDGPKGPWYQSYRARVEFYCGRERYSVLTWSEHSEPHAGGDIVGSGAEGAGHEYDIPPGTFEATWSKFVCASALGEAATTGSGL